MKMVPLDIVDGSYSDEDKSFSAQDTVNYLPTSAEQSGTRTQTMLKTPPGLRPAVLIGVNEGEAGMVVAGAVRNTYNAEGRFFAVAGNRLFQITPTGIAIPLGTVPGVNRVSFAHNQITNGNEILVTNGNSGYIYNTVTQVFQRITDTSYPGGLGGVFINNRFVQIEPGRRYAFNSALADGLSYNALDRFTSETSPDLLMALQSIGNQLAVFSTTTTEWFEDTGANPQPFRSTGIVADKGAAGPFSTAKLDNQLFFLGDDGVFYRYQGYNPVRISTKPIEQAIRNLNWFNVFTTVWEDSGYAVCYWTFPDGQTWGYDASSGKWHRRESYGFNRWRANSLTYWRNAWYAGDFQNGRLWQLDWGYTLEGDEEFESIRAAGVVSDNQNRVIHERLEAIMDTGMVETVPISFEDQPEGPTISGTLPDGSVAISWAGGTFTAADGTPPYRFSSRPGTSFPGNLGPLQATGVVASETPDTAGVGTVVARVVDANGLFAETTAMFVIAPPMMAIYGTNAVNSSDYRVGSGINWPGSWTLRLGIQGTYGLIGTEETFVLYQVTGHPLYSEDFGATFPASTGAQQNGSGGARHGWYSRRDNVVALPQASANGVNISQDKGRTYTATGTYAASSVACIEKEGGENRWIIIQDSDVRVGYSIDKFTTQSSFTAIPDASFAIDCPTWANSEFCLVGGSTPLPYAPKLWRTTDGVTLTPETIPAGLTGQAIVVIGGGTIGDNEYIVIATDTGKRAYLDPADGQWKMCSTDFIGRPWGIAYNEAVITMIGGNQSSGDTDGYIDYTLDGENFTTSLTWPLNSGENGRAIAAMITP